MNQQNLKKKKNKKREHILWLCIGVALLAICGTILGVVLHEPSVETVPNFPTDGTTTTGEHVDVSTEPYERKEGYYTFLIAGVDDVSMSTDVMMLASLDTENKKIHVVQLPRDTFVNAEVGGFTTVHRVNAVFTGEYNRQVNKGISQKTAKTLAMQALCDRLETQLCITIDEYVLINTSGFCSIIDAVGGVNFEVPFDMFYEDPEQDLYINIPKGWQHLDGYNAMGFVRYREGYVQADLGRVNAQKIFITAMINQAKAVIKNFDVAAMSNMAQAVWNSVSTDLTVSDILYYAKFLMNVDLESISMMTLPGDLSSDGYFVMNRADTLKAVNEYFNIYEKEITNSIFDPRYTFCYTNLQYLCDLYFAGSATYFGEVVNADDVNNGSIHIPHT